MFFGHSAALWQQFPQLVPGVLVVSGVHPEVDVSARLEPWHARARERLARAPESELAEVSAWRRAYAQMGLKPTQYRSAAEALLRRFRREGDLPRLHPLVDLCNAISLAFALPVAVLDLAGVDRHLEVRHAAGGEEHVGFNGEIEHAEPGEVIFADAASHAHARRWTFRQSRRSTVTADTHDVLIVAEGLHPTAGADVPALIDALAGGLETLWGAPRHRVVLTAAAPRLEFEA
ncbi:MAG TPA: phenylalanine--tRNA ligase beta subunit-related protein [Methylomirabilota bacterium]|nr:phenylalanine--tRNA ligase beta subunit-related protein [Methylomirabilota bacterium]